MGMGEMADRILERRPLGMADVIDIHTHMGRTAAFPIYGADADSMVRQMDRVGVASICCAHQAALSAEVVYGNDQVLEGMRSHPERIRGYASVYPRTPETGIDEAKRCLDAGMIGIKMHNVNTIPYDSPLYASIWELADDEELPVLLHTWGDMDRYESVFEDYPNARPLLAHSGCLNPAPLVEQLAARFPSSSRATTPMVS